MPITFETASVFRRKKRSGISGSATTASMAMKIANSTAAAPSSPSVRGAVQPISLPPTIA